MNNQLNAAYREKLEARLSRWEAMADQLLAEAREKAADGKIALHQEIESLRHRLDTARNKVAQMRKGAAQSLAAFHDEMEYDWESLKEAWEVLKNRLGHRQTKKLPSSS